jgi:hypothetical protein
MNRCLNCEREFPPELAAGEIEPDGFMLCIECGHVMIWTEDLTLRELTESERIDAGHHRELMQARAKIIPSRGVQHPGSWVMTCLISLIIAMVVLERLRIIEVLHHAPR